MTDRTPIDEAIEWAEDALKYEQEEMAGNKYDQSERYLIVLCALRAYKAAEGNSELIAKLRAERDVLFKRECCSYYTTDLLDEAIAALSSQPTPEVGSRSRLKRVAIQKGEPVPTFEAVGDEMTPPIKDSLSTELTADEIAEIAMYYRHTSTESFARAVIAADRALRNGEKP